MTNNKWNQDFGRHNPALRRLDIESEYGQGQGVGIHYSSLVIGHSSFTRQSLVPSPQLLTPSPRANATTPFRPAAVFLLATIAVCLTGCFGYQVGNHTLFPQHVRTVSVQMFHSDSFRRNIGEQLTEAVAKEIENRMDCKVVDSTEADATLAGRVVSATKNGLTETRNDDLREIEYNLYILVEWHVHGSPAGPQGEMVAIPSSLLEFNRASSLVPEVGQSIATAQQKAIQRLARQIVDQLETPWYADGHVE